MSTDVERIPAFETNVSSWIHVVGICIEIFGVFIIVAGIVWSTYLCVHWRTDTQQYDQYKIRIGRSLLLGLLAGLVLVRTFLSWTLVLEIEGRWPWQRELPMSVAREADNSPQ